MNTTELTEHYIETHKSIKDCLKKGIINYSSLARKIAKELEIEKKTSKDAILIAALRYQKKIKQEINQEEQIRLLLRHSELEIKNKISVFVLEKGAYLDSLIELEKKARKNEDAFFSVEGTRSITVMASEKYDEDVRDSFKSRIIRSSKGNAVVIIKSSVDIEKVSGVLGYVANLFHDNNVNIIECLSCWTDTLFIVRDEDIAKVMQFMKF